jgi:pyruvate ferredoxin oxidoreductase delta subunit
MSVVVKDGKVKGFILDYCKGCGICALECPGKKGAKAIRMEKEDNA